jgi:hypothetical protein
MAGGAACGSGVAIRRSGGGSERGSRCCWRRRPSWPSGAAAPHSRPAAASQQHRWPCSAAAGKGAQLEQRRRRGMHELARAAAAAAAWPAACTAHHSMHSAPQHAQRSAAQQPSSHSPQLLHDGVKVGPGCGFWCPAGLHQISVGGVGGQGARGQLVGGRHPEPRAALVLHLGNDLRGSVG